MHNSTALRCCMLLAIAQSSTAFVVAPKGCNAPKVLSSLHMGLFDGVKEAFKAPALEKSSSLSSERETPIDRWMGWSVTSDNANTASIQEAAAVDFVDAMDESNYIAVELPKPMGIIFEENDAEFGGIFVQSLKEDGAAAKDGTLQENDQLVAVNTEKVSKLSFDDALGKIVEATGLTTKLVLFRGSAQQLYGPTGASQEWLSSFVAKGGVAVQK